MNDWKDRALVAEAALQAMRQQMEKLAESEKWHRHLINAVPAFIEFEALRYAADGKVEVSGVLGVLAGRLRAGNWR